jgi:hypothetical protein
MRKRGIINFLIYQLTNDLKNQLDFGFGLFDESGNADQNGIQKIMRDYIFSCCFQIADINPSGAKFFVDYIFSNYEHTVDYGGLKYKLDIKSIARVVGENELKEYWIASRESIKEQTKSLTGVLSVGDYKIDYQTELPHLFEILDGYSMPQTVPAIVDQSE